MRPLALFFDGHLWDEFGGSDTAGLSGWKLPTGIRRLLLGIACGRFCPFLESFDGLKFLTGSGKGCVQGISVSWVLVP